MPGIDFDFAEFHTITHYLYLSIVSAYKFNIPVRQKFSHIAGFIQTFTGFGMSYKTKFCFFFVTPVA